LQFWLKCADTLQIHFSFFTVNENMQAANTGSLARITNCSLGSPQAEEDD